MNINSNRLIRTIIFLALIAFVHAALTHTLTNYYQKKVASIYVNTITGYLDSGDEVDFKESANKVLEQTEHLGNTLSFLYMPTWPIWNYVSAISSDGLNLDEVSYQKQKEKSKNIFNIFIITNSIIFSICLWLFYKIIIFIKPSKKQTNTQPGHLQ